MLDLEGHLDRSMRPRVPRIQTPSHERPGQQGVPAPTLASPKRQPASPALHGAVEQRRNYRCWPAPAYSKRELPGRALAGVQASRFVNAGISDDGTGE